MHIYHYIQHICERQGLLFYLHVLLVGEGPQLMILPWAPIFISRSLLKCNTIKGKKDFSATENIFPDISSHST